MKQTAQSTLPNRNIRSVVSQGTSAAWPICLGYIPIGLALGVLAQKAGLRPFEIGLMSLFVFAGSSQFIAISMIAAGAAPAAIITTTFMVNLRHLLMSSSLAVFLNGVPRSMLSFFAYGITDESFAVNHTRFAGGDWDLNRALVLNQMANFFWILSTIIGAYGGQFIPAHAFGIDYALIAMFICLLVIQLRGRIFWLTALFSGVLATTLAIWLPGNSYIVVATIVAAGFGVVLKRANEDNRVRKSSETTGR